MRLENYIIEQEEGLDYFIPKIQQECKPFLKDIKGAAGTIFRLDTKNNNKPIWKKTVRKNRRPLDTTVDIHNEIDNLFLKKYGWRARSEGLFCWIKMFNDIFFRTWLVFPVGNYKYLWSPSVEDLWNQLGNISSNNTQDNVEYFEDTYIDTYYSDRIKMAVKYGVEVMVKCDYAYLVKIELIESVNEMLGLNWQGAKFRGRKI